VVIDTPPSRNALDLLDAPGRMREFFGSRLLKWLTVPYRSRLFTAASKPFYQVADRILGSRFLQDIAEFFVLFQTMEKGFVTRAKEVERLLTDQRTAFIVVTTLEAAPAFEAGYLATELRRRSMPLGGLVLNRTVPAEMCSAEVTASAERLADSAADGTLLSATAELVDAPAEEVGAVLAEVAERFHDVAIVASREAERRRSLAGTAPIVADVPTMSDDIHDLAGLLTIATYLH
jgi:anion-transporting  ArsA/GET3 family ATPase